MAVGIEASDNKTPRVHASAVCATPPRADETNWFPPPFSDLRTPSTRPDSGYHSAGNAPHYYKMCGSIITGTDLRRSLVMMGEGLQIAYTPKPEECDQVKTTLQVSVCSPLLGKNYFG